MGIQNNGGVVQHYWQSDGCLGCQCEYSTSPTTTLTTTTTMTTSLTTTVSSTVSSTASSTVSSTLTTTATSTALPEDFKNLVPLPAEGETYVTGEYLFEKTGFSYSLFRLHRHLQEVVIFAIRDICSTSSVPHVELTSARPFARRRSTTDDSFVVG